MTHLSICHFILDKVKEFDIFKIQVRQSETTFLKVCHVTLNTFCHIFHSPNLPILRCSEHVRQYHTCIEQSVGHYIVDMREVIWLALV